MRKNEKGSAAIGGLVGFIIMICFVLLIGFWIESCKCNARFPDVDSKYGMVSGCLVKSPEGWIPDDRYRVID